MKIAIKIVITVVVLLVGMFLIASIGLKDIQRMQINSVDLSKLDNGVYSGTFQKVRWRHEVEVTIKDHRIVAISNTNKLAGFNRTTANASIQRIIEKQSVIIDAVAGATVNTKAFQKAVENALTGGKRK